MLCSVVFKFFFAQHYNLQLTNLVTGQVIDNMDFQMANQAYQPLMFNSLVNISYCRIYIVHDLVLTYIFILCVCRQIPNIRWENDSQNKIYARTSFVSFAVTHPMVRYRRENRVVCCLHGHGHSHATISLLNRPSLRLANRLQTTATRH